MLGLTAEQKLLITPPPPRMEGSRFLPGRPSPRPVEVGTSSFSSSGFGIRPAVSSEPALLPKRKILFHWLCQFGVNTCVKELGAGGEVFEGLCFFKLRNDFTPASMWTLCKRTGEEAGDLFPEALSSLLQHPSRGWMCPSQGPLGH